MALNRELATLLRVKPRALFKSLGGYQEKKKHRIVLSGVPYAFPNLGNVIVPFEVGGVPLYFMLSRSSREPLLKAAASPRKKGRSRLLATAGLRGTLG